MSGERILDANKISFIIWVNNETQFENCCMAGLRRLVVPEGMSADVLTIDDAPSMTAGYERARTASDAKYKVYLHQDVEIVNPHFIEDLLTIFSRDGSIGMVGMIGVNCLSSNGAWWDISSNRMKGSVKCIRDEQKESVLDFQRQTGSKAVPYETVAAADGLLLATQYDVPWRDDIIGSWHFYDISQCFEFKRHGYKVVVPRQETCWVIHHERDKRTYSWLYDWDAERKKCLREYWTEIVPESSDNDKKIEILIMDNAYKAGSGKYDHLRSLKVPAGYSVNISVAQKMWKARDYRTFQEATEAKYRIFIEEKTRIVSRNFLVELLDAFSVSDRIGIIGTAGMNCLADDMAGAGGGISAQNGLAMVPVDMVTGGFIATSQPVPWDDIRYCGESFVTEAVCLDMARRGYVSMVVQPKPGKEWVRTESYVANDGISAVTLEAIADVADSVSDEALRFMQERAVINFRDCDRGEIFFKEYESDWGRIDNRLKV
ncbi:MAG: glycosyltransferase [Selenomonadaceae bacterium]|nr:glycosyltransferase [Selenomonadaceae bacterium]